jgi:hypothetical protein
MTSVIDHCWNNVRHRFVRAEVEMNRIEIRDLIASSMAAISESASQLQRMTIDGLVLAPDQHGLASERLSSLGCRAVRLVVKSETCVRFISSLAGSFGPNSFQGES